MRDYAVRLGTRDEKRQGFPGGYRNVTPRPRPRSGHARHGRRRPGGVRAGRGGLPPRPGAPPSLPARPVPPVPPGRPWRPATRARLATRPDRPHVPTGYPWRLLSARSRALRRSTVYVDQSPRCRSHRDAPTMASRAQRVPFRVGAPHVGCVRAMPYRPLGPAGRCAGGTQGRPAAMPRGRRTRTRPVRSGAHGRSGRRLPRGGGGAGPAPLLDAPFRLAPAGRRAGGRASWKVNAEAHVGGSSPVVTA